MPGYCEVDDVGAVLQDDFAGANPANDEVEAAISGQNEWLRRKTSNHWFDSGGTFTFTADRSRSDVPLSVPSSPHRQDRQLFQHEMGARYPTTMAGPYTKIRLPDFNVTDITSLEVRDRSGGVTDWVSDPNITEGRGDDYYLLTNGKRNASYLYLHAGSIGSRVDFGDLLTVGYDYGVDGIPDSVRRAVAHRAAAELVIDDDAVVGIPNDGQLVSLETKASQYRSRADDLLGPFTVTKIA